MEDKYEEIIREVLDEIDSALKDTKGLKAHQRRIAFSLSLGCVNLMNKYLVKNKVLKSGAKINHLWFKKKLDNVKKLISNQIVCPVENLPNFDNLLKIVCEIEKERNELAYGKIVSEDFLRKQINLFFDLKKEIEK